MIYKYQLQKYQIINNNSVKICKCDNTNCIPIPIKKIKEKIICEDSCCSIDCMFKILKEKKINGDMIYQYSLNILYIILPFLIKNSISSI